MSFSNIYGDFEAALRRYATGLAKGDADAADDLVQETFIRAFDNLSLLRRLDSPQRQAWLNRVLRNLFIDGERSRRRNEDLVERLVVDAEIAPFTAGDLFFHDLLENARDDDRELLEQRYVLGMTSREIAEELGIPAATVRSRLRSAIKRLRIQQSLFRQEEGGKI